MLYYELLFTAHTHKHCIQQCICCLLKKNLDHAEREPIQFCSIRTVSIKHTTILYNYIDRSIVKNLISLTQLNSIIFLDVILLLVQILDNLI